MGKIIQIICYSLSEFFLILASMLAGTYIIVKKGVKTEGWVTMLVTLILLVVLFKTLAENLNKK